MILMAITIRAVFKWVVRKTMTWKRKSTCNPALFPATFHPGMPLVIMDKINENDYSYVVNTGAMVSLIRVNNLPIGIKPRVMDFIKLPTANRLRLNSLGAVKRVVGFNSIKFSLQCLVVENLIGPNLLGTDFSNLYKQK